MFVAEMFLSNMPKPCKGAMFVALNSPNVNMFVVL